MGWGGFESGDSKLHGRYRVNREILCVVKNAVFITQRYQMYLINNSITKHLLRSAANDMKKDESQSFKVTALACLWTCAKFRNTEHLPQ